MKTNVYVKLDVSKESGYAIVKDVVRENAIEESHACYTEALNDIGIDESKIESLEGFKMRYIYLTVNYDGRKGLYEQDVKSSLEHQGYISLVSEGGIFGGYYVPTEKYNATMEYSTNKRKELAGVA
jgi:hypothetical protein